MISQVCDLKRLSSFCIIEAISSLDFQFQKDFSGNEFMISGSSTFRIKYILEGGIKSVELFLTSYSLDRKMIYDL
jgi:hypothetical protein